ncbi:MAG: tetratricopeptide repeat protein [Candidatus Helarchaeota archaeon]|nr:tetratricopeptide repeat protein [Candidatus Helarchaeota archaeon]
MSKGQKLLRNGILLTEEGKWKKSIPKLEQALEIFLTEKNQEMIALTRSFLGMAYRPLKRYEDALKQFDEFLKLVIEMKDRFGVAQAYLDISLTLSLQKKYDSALNVMKKCLKIVQEELKDKDVEARALANIGGIYLLKEDYDTALATYKKGLKISEEVDFIDGSSECYKGIAEVYEKKGNYEQAEKNYQESLGLFRLLRDRREESNILLRLGVIYSQFGKIKDAIFYFKQSKKLKKQLKDILGENFCDKNLKALHEKIKERNLKI